SLLPHVPRNATCPPLIQTSPKPVKAPSPLGTAVVTSATLLRSTAADNAGNTAAASSGRISSLVVVRAALIKQLTREPAWAAIAHIKTSLCQRVHLTIGRLTARYNSTAEHGTYQADKESRTECRLCGFFRTSTQSKIASAAATPVVT